MKRTKVMRDISAWKEDRDALEESKNYLNAAINSSAGGFCGVDRDGTVTICNAAFLKMLGFKSDADALGKKLHDILHHTRTDGGSYSKEECPIFRAARTGEPVHVEEELFYRGDGTSFPVECWTLPLIRDREVKGAVTTFIDISKRKKIEGELQAREAEFRSLADAIPQLAWMANGNGWVYWYNQRWYDFTGTTLEDLQGWGWEKLHHPDHIERVVRFVKVAWKNPEPWELTFPLRSKSGEWRWFLTRAVPGVANGKITHWFGTCTDIDDQKQIQTKLSEALIARDDFLSIASHELKTPLTSLKLRAQLHRRAITKGEKMAYDPVSVDELVAQTEKQILKLTRLVDDMLDVSRIRAGKLSLQRDSFNLCDLIEDVISRFKGQFLTSSYALPNVIRCESASGSWDRMRLEQVIANLLTNAIRYGNKNPITIRVDSRNGRVRFEVEDHGIGIAEQAQKKIFDRFERAINASEVSGLGLGLFITKQIVHAHGGRIWVESELGRGSKFIVDLPTEIDMKSAIEVTNAL